MSYIRRKSLIAKPRISRGAEHSGVSESLQFLRTLDGLKISGLPRVDHLIADGFVKPASKLSRVALQLMKAEIKAEKRIFCLFERVVEFL